MSKSLRAASRPGLGGLALQTPIPTPAGWKTMDALQPGDQVFDETGRPCAVLRKSPEWPACPAIMVRTDCGDEILAGAGQPWRVRLTFFDPPLFDSRLTADLAARGAGLRKPMAQRVSALQLPEASPPIHPYVLGVWLGDGLQASARIRSPVGERAFLRAEIESLGYATAATSIPSIFAVDGIHAALRDLGLYSPPMPARDRVRRIPGIYLRASPAQRVALLQGLVDTSGSVTKSSGSSTIRTRSPEFAQHITELVRSLGIPVRSCRTCSTAGNWATLRYQITFFMAGSARMPWKARLTRDRQYHGGAYLRFAPAPPCRTASVVVDSPSRQFLCGASLVPVLGGAQPQA